MGKNHFRRAHASHSHAPPVNTFPPQFLFLPQYSISPGQTYTLYCIFAFGLDAIVPSVRGQPESARYAAVAREGDSRRILRSFPEDVRKNLGFQIWQLQLGESPSDYRPLPSIGTGVFELRDQDARGWYRVIYLSRIKSTIYILHCFEKKSREIPRRDLEKAKQRLKAVKARLAEEKKFETRR
jgi:phage-related protein